MASGNATLQLLAPQHYGEASKALQLAAMARPIEHCSSLLWRGRQSIAARCCGEAGNRLQLAATAMANNTTTHGARPAALQLAAMAGNALQP
ncbi:unnamed protein product [Sphagnum balticum]